MRWRCCRARRPSLHPAPCTLHPAPHTCTCSRQQPVLSLQELSSARRVWMWPCRWRTRSRPLRRPSRASKRPWRRQRGRCGRCQGARLALEGGSIGMLLRGAPSACWVVGMHGELEPGHNPKRCQVVAMQEQEAMNMRRTRNLEVQLVRCAGGGVGAGVRGEMRAHWIISPSPVPTTTGRDDPHGILAR